MQAEVESLLADVRSYLEVAAHLGMDGLPLSASERPRHTGGQESRAGREDFSHPDRAVVSPREPRAGGIGAAPAPGNTEGPRSGTFSPPRPPSSAPTRAQPEERQVERTPDQESTTSKFGPSRALLQSLSPLLSRAVEPTKPAEAPLPTGSGDGRSGEPSFAGESRSFVRPAAQAGGAPRESAAGERSGPSLGMSPSDSRPASSQAAFRSEAPVKRVLPSNEQEGFGPSSGPSRPEGGSAAMLGAEGPAAVRARPSIPASPMAQQVPSHVGAPAAGELTRPEEPLSVPTEPVDPNQGSLFAAVERKRPTRVKLFEQAFPSPPPQDRVAALSRFESEVGLCTRCQLCNSRGCLVFGRGNALAEVLLVGDAPGSNEEASGQPLTGEAAALLARILQTMLQRSLEDVFMVNAVLCSPMPGSSPGDAELGACRSHLDKVIEVIRPRVIITLGPVAVRALMTAAEPLARLRGHWYSYRSIPLMPTFHPRDLLLNQALKRPVKEDMEQVAELLGLSPRRGRG